MCIVRAKAGADSRAEGGGGTRARGGGRVRVVLRHDLGGGAAGSAVLCLERSDGRGARQRRGRAELPARVARLLLEGTVALAKRSGRDGLDACVCVRRGEPARLGGAA